MARRKKAAAPAATDAPAVPTMPANEPAASAASPVDDLLKAFADFLEGYPKLVGGAYTPTVRDPFGQYRSWLPGGVYRGKAPGADDFNVVVIDESGAVREFLTDAEAERRGMVLETPA